MVKDGPNRDDASRPPPEKKKPGRPWTKTQGNGFLQQQITAAEAEVKQLTEARALLQEENDRQQSEVEVYESGISAADAHLTFLLVTRCAFSRKTRAVLRLEGGNQAS